MSKVVRWRGKFADIKNKQYAVDIYGEGDEQTAVKTIVLGENPLTTEEDDNDDLFTPVRTQTGTLEVLDPDGTLMEEMLPSDNLDHPVRVYEVATGKVVWQGFLSCEAYSQDYTARAQVVELNLLGVLEAAKSIHVDTTDQSIFAQPDMQIGWMVWYMLKALGGAYVEGDVYDTVHYSTRTSSVFTENRLSWSMVTDVTSYVDGYKKVYADDSLSVYDMLEAMAKSFGWSVCEYGREIFLCENGDHNIYSHPFAEFPQGIPYGNYGKRYVHMNQLTYMGTGHERTFMAPARVVTVSGKADYDEKVLEMEFPTDADWIRGKHSQINQNGNLPPYLYIFHQEHSSPLFSNAVHRALRASYALSGTGTIMPTEEEDLDAAYSGSSFHYGSQQRRVAMGQTGTLNNIRSCSYFVKACLDGEDKWDRSYKEYSNALYCPMFYYRSTDGGGRFGISSDDYIFRLRSPKPIHFKQDEYLLMKARVQVLRTDSTGRVELVKRPVRVALSLRVGESYYVGGRWDGGTTKFFWADFTENGNIANNWESMRLITTLPYLPKKEDGHFIHRVNKPDEYSFVEFGVYPYVSGSSDDEGCIFDVFFEQMEIVRVPYMESEANSDDSYVSRRVCKQSGMDDIDIEVPIMSNHNNLRSRNIIRDDAGDQTYSIKVYNKTMCIEDALSEEVRKFYQRKHDVISIEVAAEEQSQRSAIYGTVRAGEPYDYYPLGFSRDWRMRTDTIKLIGN